MDVVDIPLGPTAKIAAWISSVPRKRTGKFDDQAVAGILDLMGCMLGGWSEKAACQAAEVVSEWGSGEATIVGRAGGFAAPWAALANGTAAHVLDYDDSFAPLTGHPSATLVPAILALAEERNASGRDVLDAFIVGLEVIACIGRAVNPAHYSAGWHGTATIGAIGAAAACARLLGLGPEQTANAISLAVSGSSGSRMQLGFPAKSIHAGLAAKAGLLSASLAAHGVSGNPEALSGRWRFVSMYDAGDAATDSFTLPPDDAELAISTPGITFKPYPTCGSTHRSVDAILDLRAKHRFGEADIAGIELVIPSVNANNLIYPEPRSGMEARFSMQYCGAVAVAYGGLRLSDFEGNAIHRKNVRTLMPRITMSSLPGSENSQMDYLDLPAHTAIHLVSGQVLTDTRYARRGSAEAPMTTAEHTDKFRDCAKTTLAPEEIATVLSLIAALPELSNIRELTRALRPRATAQAASA